MTIKTLHVESGLFIPDTLLKEAGIETSTVEIEISDHQIRIIPSPKTDNKEKGIISPDSQFWNLVGSVKTPGINGRDHDAYLNMNPLF